MLIRVLTLVVCLILSACGSANNNDATGDIVFEGTLSVTGGAVGRSLGAGDGGVPGVRVSALGATDTTDEFGNFRLNVSNQNFTVGNTTFSFIGGGFNTSVTVSNVSNRVSFVTEVDFLVLDNGSIVSSDDVLTDSREFDFGEPTAPSAQVIGSSMSSTRIRRFLWKPDSERDGNVVVLVDPIGVRVTARGAVTETFTDFGPSNDRGTTARGSRAGCAYGANIEIELRDRRGLPMALADGTFPIIVRNGCDRDDRNL